MQFLPNTNMTEFKIMLNTNSVHHENPKIRIKMLDNNSND